MCESTAVFSLQGKTTLIAGGHGVYGDALVKGFASTGIRTYVAARNMEALEKLRQKYSNVFPLYLDLAQPDTISALVDLICSKEDRIDVLVNNAVARTMQNYSDPIEAFKDSMAVNATGLFQLTRLVGEQMKKQRAGSIINIGSIQGMVGPDASLYEGLDMSGFIPDYFFS